MTNRFLSSAKNLVYAKLGGPTHLGELGKERDDLAARLERAEQQLAVVEAREAEARRAHAEAIERYGDSVPFVPNGHFYSPVPSRLELEKDAERIFGRPLDPPSGINLRAQAQLALLQTIGELCADQPFTERASGGRRYGFENSAYSYSDALCLHGMLRHLRPRRLIEVGSGHSSCMTLDTRELFLEGAMDCTFIEPYPELLHSLIRDGDRASTRVIAQRVQDVDLAVFRELQSGDVLFIDSTHVSKAGSDVNYLYFEVLPALAHGVYIHIHDIFYPFEYPKEWVIGDGRAWNELYLLRALLQDSNTYEVQLMTTYLASCHRAAFHQALPLSQRNSGGSIWLRKNVD